MRGWFLRSFTILVAAASLAIGQVGNGTITGTITDPAGAVVAGAAVAGAEARSEVDPLRFGE